MRGYLGLDLGTELVILRSANTFTFNIFLQLGCLDPLLKSLNFILHQRLGLHGAGILPLMLQPFGFLQTQFSEMVLYNELNSS